MLHSDLTETPGFIRGRSINILRRTQEVFPLTNKKLIIRGNSFGVIELSCPEIGLQKSKHNSGLWKQK